MNGKKDNFIVFGIGLTVAAAVGLSIIPGLDFLVWHLLAPVGFWERVVVIGLEAVTAIPRAFFASLLFVGIMAFAQELA